MRNHARWVAVALLVAGSGTARAGEPGSAWQTVEIIADGFGAPHRRAAPQGGRILRLRGASATEVWLRLAIEDAESELPFADSRLRLRLRRPVRRAQTVDLALGISVEPRTTRPGAARRDRRYVAVHPVRVELREGDTEFFLHDQLATMVEEARHADEWSPGGRQLLNLVIWRTDGARRERIDLLSTASGSGAEAEICAGECVKIACLGDSNTESWRGTPFEALVPEVWCDILVGDIGRSDWRSHNLGFEGGFAGDLRDEEEFLTSIGVLVAPHRHLMGQFETVLREQSPDIVVAAAGLSDLVFLPGLFDDRQIADYLIALHRRGRDLGIDTYVALIQPMAPGVTIGDAGERSLAINQLLLESASELDGRLIDFYTGFSVEHFFDPVHFSLSGHIERARRVREALSTADLP